MAKKTTSTRARTTRVDTDVLDRLLNKVQELESQVKSLKSVPASTGNDWYDQQIQAESRARNNLKSQNKQIGKYHWKVRHYQLPLSDQNKKDPRQRRWGFINEFWCDEKDERAALQVYRERTGLRGDKPNQVKLELVSGD